MEWTRQAVEVLIEEWRSHPCLFQTRNPLYHNKHARKEALASCQRKLASLKSGVKVDDIQKKMSSLRSHLGAEVAKMKKKKSGDGGDSFYVPTVWWFESLQFLRDEITPRQSKSNLVVPETPEFPEVEFQTGTQEGLEILVPVLEGTQFEEETHESVSMLEPMFLPMAYSPTPGPSTEEKTASPPPPPSPRKESSYCEPTSKRRKSSQEAVFDKAEKILTNVLKEKKKEKEPGGEEEFGQYISKEISRIRGENKKLELKKKILNLIIDARIEDLN